MKVFYRGGKVNAQAESMADIQILMGLKATKVEGISGNQNNGGNNAWKGKHRVECTICHKGYKNLKLHEMLKHPQLYESKYPKAI